MPQKISTSIISILTIINFIGIIIIFISISQYNSSNFHKRRIPQNNYNYTYYNEKKYKSFEINNTNSIYEEKEIKMKSSYYSPFYKNYLNLILALNLLLFYFCFSLLFSFCIGDNECECNNCCCRGCGTGDCNCGSGDNGNGLIFCLIIIIIIAIIYFSTKLCGKHSSRYISLSFISLIHFSIIIISLISLNVGDSTIKYNIIISTFYFICNLLGMILPNLKKCENLRYEYNPTLEIINFPQNPQAINNRISINNYNNSNKNQTDNNYNVPIVKNEYNNSFPQEHINDSYIGNNEIPIKSSNSSINQNSIENENLGNAPLPIDDLPSEKDISSTTEKEINSSSSNK